MKRHILALLSVAVILVSSFVAVPLHAQAPVLPHAFFGSIEINGSPAPVGTQVEAQGANVLSRIESNPLAVAEAGRYGGSGAFAAKLIVQGKIANDTSISFYINGTKAECAVPGGVWQSSYPFRSGVVTELLLRVGGSSSSTSTPTSLPTTQPAVTSTKTALSSLTSTPTSLPTNQPTAKLTKTTAPRPTATRATQAAAESPPTEGSTAAVPTAQVSIGEPTTTPQPRATMGAIAPVPTALSTIVAGPAQGLTPTGAADTPDPTAAANLETPVSVRSALAGAHAPTPAAVAQHPASGTKPILMPTTMAPESQRVAGSRAEDFAPVRVALWLGLAALALAGLGIPVLIFFMRRR
jgi:hypothetical protein